MFCLGLCGWVSLIALEHNFLLYKAIFTLAKFAAKTSLIMQHEYAEPFLHWPHSA
jgi:hypothetical protein